MVKYFTISLNSHPITLRLSTISLSRYLFSPSQPIPSLPKLGGTTHQPAQPNSGATHRLEPLTDQCYPLMAPPTYGATTDRLHTSPSSHFSHEVHRDLTAKRWLGFLMVALILLVAVPVWLPLHLLGCWIFMWDSLFVDFLFRSLIWFYGCFSVSDMDFWVVDGCFLGGWWWFWWLLGVWVDDGGRWNGITGGWWLLFW